MLRHDKITPDPEVEKLLLDFAAKKGQIEAAQMQEMQRRVREKKFK